MAVSAVIGYGLLAVYIGFILALLAASFVALTDNSIVLAVLIFGLSGGLSIWTIKFALLLPRRIRMFKVHKDGATPGV